MKVGSGEAVEESPGESELLTVSAVKVPRSVMDFFPGVLKAVGIEQGVRGGQHPGFWVSLDSYLRSGLL